VTRLDPEFDRHVFINCPFDREYVPIFEAVVFEHSNDPRIAVARVRDWLRSESEASTMPGGAAIYDRYVRFRGELPEVARELRLDVHNLTFADFSRTIAMWLEQNP